MNTKIMFEAGDDAIFHAQGAIGAFSVTAPGVRITVYLTREQRRAAGDAIYELLHWRQLPETDIGITTQSGSWVFAYPQPDDLIHASRRDAVVVLFVSTIGDPNGGLVFHMTEASAARACGVLSAVGDAHSEPPRDQRTFVDRLLARA